MVPKAPKIMVIRHAEKPTGQLSGVTEAGMTNGHDLIVRGWQRAGALACLFAPAQGSLQDALLTKPEFIFASAAADDPQPGNSKSRRPEETVTPLALLIGRAIILTFSKGQEKGLVEAAKACNGVVLIVWQHENINAIANAILSSAEVAPQIWPDDRFDMVFVFTLDPISSAYHFAQVPQRLLAGDSGDQI